MCLSLARRPAAGSTQMIRKQHMTADGKIKKGHDAAFKRSVITYIMKNQM
jgi:hypothetical protein